MGQASKKVRVFRDYVGSAARSAPSRFPAGHALAGVRLDTVSLHCTMDAGRRAQTFGSPLAELSVMAIDQRENSLDDTWRNPLACVARADTGKRAHLIGCPAESH